jgi:hypothetical protein
MKTIIEKQVVLGIAAALISGAAWGQSDDLMALEEQIEKLQGTLAEMQTTVCNKLDEQTEIMRAQLVYLKLQKNIDVNDPTQAVNRTLDNDVTPYDLQEASRLGHLVH